MTETADAIVIGAGVQGASLAFQLAEKGLRPLVLERAALASGATGRSSGLVRMHYDLEPEARLAWASFAYFRDWHERVGGECGFTRTGFLQLYPRHAEARLRANAEMQQRVGIPTLLVTAGDVVRLAPHFRADDFDWAAYEPDSGYADPSGTTSSLLNGARERGARLLQGCEVTGIRVEGERVTGVETSRGTFAAPVVVNAAGAWARAVAAMVGLEVPVTVWRHDTAYIRRPAPLRQGHPTVIDDGNAMYFRPEGRDLTLVGLEDDENIGGGPDQVLQPAPGFVERVVDRICRRVPSMVDGELHSTQRGQDGMTPDQRPILGAAGPDGFYLDCGFSGTGFKTAPAVGACMAELIVSGRAATVDIAPFGLSRFAAGRLLAGPYEDRPTWR
ncbi:MAG: NAD(P)/FAD-dependent oxidoreductase [Candidatus Limnocylindrales bacterium]